MSYCWGHCWRPAGRAKPCSWKVVRLLLCGEALTLPCFFCRQLFFHMDRSTVFISKCDSHQVTQRRQICFVPEFCSFELDSHFIFSSSGWLRRWPTSLPLVWLYLIKTVHVIMHEMLNFPLLGRDEHGSHPPLNKDKNINSLNDFHHSVNFISYKVRKSQWDLSPGLGAGCFETKTVQAQNADLSVIQFFRTQHSLQANMLVHQCSTEERENKFVSLPISYLI